MEMSINVKNVFQSNPEIQNLKNDLWKISNKEILLQIYKHVSIVHPHCLYLIQTQTVLNSLITVKTPNQSISVVSYTRV